MKNFNSVPIVCPRCQCMAYPQEQITNYGTTKLLECTWVCRRCSNMVRRESEPIVEEQNNADKKKD